MSTATIREHIRRSLASIGADVHFSARISEDGQVGEFATIGELATIAAGASVGARAAVAARACIGEGAHIGEDAHVGEFAKIARGARVAQGARIARRAAVPSVDVGKWVVAVVAGSGQDDPMVRIGCQVHELSVWEAEWEEVASKQGEVVTDHEVNLIRAILPALIEATAAAVETSAPEGQS